MTTNDQKRLRECSDIVYASDRALDMLRDGFPLSDATAELERRIRPTLRRRALRRLEVLRRKEGL